MPKTKAKVPCSGKLENGPGKIGTRCRECGRAGGPDQNEGDCCPWLVERDVTPAKRPPKHQRAKQAYPEIIRGMLARGEKRAALKLAAGFSELGEQKAAIVTGWSAVQRPEWYKGLGKDPAKLEEAGVDALRARFGSNP